MQSLYEYLADVLDSGQAAFSTLAEILGDLPDLEADDVPEALRFAAEAVRERGLLVRQTA
jgi:uncharacterized protein (DUF433 family)